jgi:hypothetical protein
LVPAEEVELVGIVVGRRRGSAGGVLALLLQEYLVVAKKRKGQKRLSTRALKLLKKEEGVVV